MLLRIGENGVLRVGVRPLVDGLAFTRECALVGEQVAGFDNPGVGRDGFTRREDEHVPWYNIRCANVNVTPLSPNLGTLGSKLTPCVQ